MQQSITETVGNNLELNTSEFKYWDFCLLNLYDHKWISFLFIKMGTITLTLPSYCQDDVHKACNSFSGTYLVGTY